jgi:hypothetical protein
VRRVSATPAPCRAATRAADSGPASLPVAHRHPLEPHAEPPGQPLPRGRIGGEGAAEGVGRGLAEDINGQRPALARAGDQRRMEAGGAARSSQLLADAFEIRHQIGAILVALGWRPVDRGEIRRQVDPDHRRAGVLQPLGGGGVGVAPAVMVREQEDRPRRGAGGHQHHRIGDQAGIEVRRRAVGACRAATGDGQPQRAQDGGEAGRHAQPSSARPRLISRVASISTSAGAAPRATAR